VNITTKIRTYVSQSVNASSCTAQVVGVYDSWMLVTLPARVGKSGPFEPQLLFLCAVDAALWLYA
jgi:hypothetical protein